MRRGVDVYRTAREEQKRIEERSSVPLFEKMMKRFDWKPVVILGFFALLVGTYFYSIHYREVQYRERNGINIENCYLGCVGLWNNSYEARVNKLGCTCILKTEQEGGCISNGDVIFCKLPSDIFIEHELIVTRNEDVRGK